MGLAYYKHPRLAYYYEALHAWKAGEQRIRLVCYQIYFDVSCFQNVLVLEKYLTFPAYE